VVRAPGGAGGGCRLSIVGGRRWCNAVLCKWGVLMLCLPAGGVWQVEWFCLDVG